MKKFLIFVVVLVVAYFAYDFYKSNQVPDIIEQEAVIEPQFDLVYDASEHVYKKDSLSLQCDQKSEITCAVETMIKCSITPDLDICEKDKMPEFVFMQDENLGRPSEISYQISAIKTIDLNTIEVVTQSQCDGQWFGLCQGNVIYVVDNLKGFFRVKDVYALGN